MMNLINSVHNEYNENILSDNWNSSSGIGWSATNNVGTLMMEDSTKCYAENKSLKLTCTGYDSSDTEFGPTWLNDLTFVAPRSGKYLFSFRVNLSSGVFDPKPEVTGEFRFIESISAVNTLIPFTLGTNTAPEFTFEYDAWQTFYSEITLVAGGVYKLGACKIFQEGAYSPGVVEMYFAGFKMEYIEDRAFEIPTYYTKPVANDKDLGTYRETFSSLLTIQNTDKIINFTANSFSYVVPTAIGIKGKTLEFINSGSGVPTLTAFGSETINNTTSLEIASNTGVKIISDGANWKTIDKFRAETLNRTQWVQNIATTVINNTTSLNILTLIPNASKAANGTDYGVNTLDIVSNGIKTNWRGSIMSHHIRVGLNIVTGTDQHYNLTLRRVVDNSIIGVVVLNRNADTGFCSADFLTYTYGAGDPFVLNGFYLSLDNNSGQAVSIDTSLNLLITTYFK